MTLPVAVLGATGSVGQMFVRLLENHPTFFVSEVAASERSAGKTYGQAVALPLSNSSIKDLKIKTFDAPLTSRFVFSALDASVAGEVESLLARKGHWVISNCRNHRYDPDVPLLIPEVNPEHLELVRGQPFGGGAIVTNPNCCVIGLALSLKPLVEAFGIEHVHVVTMQAISGAGFRARQELDIDDNVIPFISNEEEKIEKELFKILGIRNVSVHCNRVPVSDGHTLCVSVKLRRQAVLEDVINAWDSFRSLNLPSAPKRPIYYFREDCYPQPKHHRGLENGMAIAIGRARKCPLFDFKYVTLSHNTVRGAAGCAILNAELFLAKFDNKNCDIIRTASLVGELA